MQRQAGRPCGWIGKGEHRWWCRRDRTSMHRDRAASLAAPLAGDADRRCRRCRRCSQADGRCGRCSRCSRVPHQNVVQTPGHAVRPCQDVTRTDGVATHGAYLCIISTCWPGQTTSLTTVFDKARCQTGLQPMAVRLILTATPARSNPGTQAHNSVGSSKHAPRPRNCSQCQASRPSWELNPAVPSAPCVRPWAIYSPSPSSVPALCLAWCCKPVPYNPLGPAQRLRPTPDSPIRVPHLPQTKLHHIEPPNPSSETDVGTCACQTRLSSPLTATRPPHHSTPRRGRARQLLPNGPSIVS